VNAIEQAGGSTITWNNGVTVSLGWTIGGGVYGVNDANGEGVDAWGAITEASGNLAGNSRGSSWWNGLGLAAGAVFRSPSAIYAADAAKKFMKSSKPDPPLRPGPNVAPNPGEQDELTKLA
jgi:hypothetical protein